MNFQFSLYFETTTITVWFLSRHFTMRQFDVSDINNRFIAILYLSCVDARINSVSHNQKGSIFHPFFFKRSTLPMSFIMSLTHSHASRSIMFIALRCSKALSLCDLLILCRPYRTSYSFVQVACMHLVDSILWPATNPFLTYFF